MRSRAEELAAAGSGAVSTRIFAAYLVRNLPDPDPVLAGLRDLLAPGAPLAIHDYAWTVGCARAIWTAVCWTVIIPAGKVVTGRAALYRYLWRSVLRFDTVDRRGRPVRRARLGRYPDRHDAGWERGIVHTVVARRRA